MKRLWVILLSAFLLVGCAQQQVYETMEDEIYQSVAALQQTVHITLPQEAVQQVMGSAQLGRIYLCDGYTVTVQVFAAGDLDRTLKELTGFRRQALSPMCTQMSGITRYEWVWSAAAEAEDQIGRGVILDDGSYHYSVCVMAPASQAGQLAQDIQSIFDSVSLGGAVSTDP